MYISIQNNAFTEDFSAFKEYLIQTMEELFSPIDGDGESSAFSIKELIHLGRLPLVVKKCAAPPGQTGKIEDVGFPDDEEVLLDRVTDVQMMEIKVGPFVNDERRHRWRGDRYLIPAGFPGKLKFTVRPWSRQKYITIKEVSIYSLNTLNNLLYVQVPTMGDHE